MAITVSKIYNTFASQFKLRLVAGKKGISKYVSWVYYTENPETIEFIRGGELAITTGLNIERQKYNSENFEGDFATSFLKDFIENFITHHASGLIVNTGKYINEIPEEIINYCDEQSFPLFVMPWDIHTIDIMQDIGNLISSDNYNSHSIESFFYKAIFEPDQLDLNQLDNTTFFDAKSYSIALIELQPQVFDNDLEQTKRYVKYFFNTKINMQSDKYCCFIHKQKIVYVIKDDNIAFVKELTRVLHADKLLNGMRISISDSCSTITDLPSSFNHAEIAMRIKRPSSKEVHYYNDMGIFKILVDVKNEKTLETIYTDVLGCLESLEKDKRDDYLKTLYLFLKHSGNFQLVAEKNCIHRNTAIYRISRLEELMNIDLSDGETRCLVMTALYIKELLAH